jgi:hypothetical protein
MKVVGWSNGGERKLPAVSLAGAHIDSIRAL